MRRLISLVFAGAMVATLAGTTLAAPTRTDSLWGGCLATTTLTPSVREVANWSGYHPDTLVTVAWVTGSSTVYTYPVSRSVDWKFGNADYSTDLATWSTAAPTLAWTTDTNVAVKLYSHGRFLAQTNSVAFTDAGC